MKITPKKVKYVIIVKITQGMKSEKMYKTDQSDVILAKSNFP